MARTLLTPEERLIRRREQSKEYKRKTRFLRAYRAQRKVDDDRKALDDTVEEATGHARGNRGKQYYSLLESVQESEIRRPNITLNVSSDDESVGVQGVGETRVHPIKSPSHSSQREEQTSQTPILSEGNLTEDSESDSDQTSISEEGDVPEIYREIEQEEEHYPSVLPNVTQTTFSKQPTGDKMETRSMRLVARPATRTLTPVLNSDNEVEAENAPLPNMDHESTGQFSEPESDDGRIQLHDQEYSKIYDKTPGNLRAFEGVAKLEGSSNWNEWFDGMKNCALGLNMTNVLIGTAQLPKPPRPGVSKKHWNTYMWKHATFSKKNDILKGAIISRVKRSFHLKIKSYLFADEMIKVLDRDCTMGGAQVGLNLLNNIWEMKFNPSIHATFKDFVDTFENKIADLHRLRGEVEIPTHLKTLMFINSVSGQLGTWLDSIYTSHKIASMGEGPELTFDHLVARAEAYWESLRSTVTEQEPVFFTNGRKRTGGPQGYRNTPRRPFDPTRVPAGKWPLRGFPSDPCALDGHEGHSNASCYAQRDAGMRNGYPKDRDELGTSGLPFKKSRPNTNPRPQPPPPRRPAYATFGAADDTALEGENTAAYVGPMDI